MHRENIRRTASDPPDVPGMKQRITNQMCKKNKAQQGTQGICNPESAREVIPEWPLSACCCAGGTEVTASIF